MNGWGPNDGVLETIESTINDAIDWVRLELELASQRVSNELCDECEEVIPLGRRLAVPGVLFCAGCQTDHDKHVQSYVNRRGCKDSQLR